MLGYITRAKMHDKAFSSLGGYYVVPDEENKKLIITEAIGEGEKKLFICHCCTDLTSLNNAKNIDSEEMKLTACNHSKLSQILFGDLEVQKVPDKKKNVIDIVKDGKETIAIVFPSQDQARRPGVIHLTSRTRRPRCDISTNIVMYLQILSISRCVTCSGQKCLHVNIYVNIYEFPMGEYCHSAIFHACSIIAEIFIQLYCPNTLDHAFQKTRVLGLTSSFALFVSSGREIQAWEAIVYQ